MLTPTLLTANRERCGSVDSFLAMTVAQLTITIFVIGLYVGVIWMIFDVIRRPDMGAAGKIFWIFAGLIFSLFAVLLYLFVGRRRHSGSSTSPTAPQ
jgi:hypothetical protein